MVDTAHEPLTLSASLRHTIDESIPPDMDVWPRVQRRVAVSGGRRTRRGVTAAVVTVALLLSAGTAIAQSDLVRIVITKLDPASVGGSIPRTAESVSLREAEQRAGIHLLRPVEGVDVRLVSVEVLAPVTEILGRPVRDPQPTVRLVYEAGDSTVTVDQMRNPDPDRAIVVAIAGSTDNIRTEGDGLTQRSYIYTPDGRRLSSTIWGTPEVWVTVVFKPAVESGLGREFVRSFR